MNPTTRVFLVWIFHTWVACVRSIVQYLERDSMYFWSHFVSCYCLKIKDKEEIEELEWGRGREKGGTDTYIIRANTLDLICYSEDNDLKLGGSEGLGGRKEELQKKGRVNTSKTDLQRRGEEV